MKVKRRKGERTVWDIRPKKLEGYLSTPARQLKEWGEKKGEVLKKTF